MSVEAIGGYRLRELSPRRRECVAGPKRRDHGLRARVIVHDWGAAAADGIGGCDQRLDVADDGSLDYDDAPAVHQVPHRGWLAAVSGICVAALMAPLAVLVAIAFCGSLLVLREIDRKIRLRRRLRAVWAARRKSGRHRATRQTLLASAGRVNGPGAPRQRSHVRLRSPAAS